MIGATRLVHLIWNTLPKIHFVQLTSNQQSPFCTEIASGGWANHFVHIEIIPNRHGEPHFVQVFFQHPAGVQNGTPSDFCVPFCGL